MMPNLDLNPKAKKFIQSLQKKQQRQLKDYILSLQNNPKPQAQDAPALIGYDNYMRSDVGEYRIIYRHDKKRDLITIVLIGKRNDNEIYRIAKRVLK